MPNAASRKLPGIEVGQSAPHVEEEIRGDSRLLRLWKQVALVTRLADRLRADLANNNVDKDFIELFNC